MRVLALISVVLAFLFACGKDDDDSGGGGDDGTDVVSPDDELPIGITSGELSGASATFPAGSFEAGTTITVESTPQPPEFNALTGILPACPTMLVAAEDADGKTVKSIAASMSLKVPVTVEPTALTALADVPKKTDNLCLALRSAAGGFYVWRYAAVTYDAATNLVSATSKLLGKYQLLYCGDAAMPDFTEM
jgi:hypothetical protein